MKPPTSFNRPRASVLQISLTLVAGLWAVGLVYYIIIGPVRMPSYFSAATSKSSVILYRQFLKLKSQTGLQSKGANGSKQFPYPRPHAPGWNKDPMDYPKPIVFFDIEIDGKPAGRITFELFIKQSPRAAENFRALCTGEKGNVPNIKGREGAGLPLHFKGGEFYRVIDAFICQAGISTESIYGSMFDDDPGGLFLKHDKKGLLSMANMGPDTNTAHFSIMMNPAPHLNEHYTIFGQVASGMDVVDKINSLARPREEKNERPRLKVVIADCGQLDCSDEAKGCQRMEIQKTN